MKIYMAPYRSDIISVRTLKYRYEIWRDGNPVTKFDVFVYTTLDYIDHLVNPINYWNMRKKRKIEIKIDGYDTWSMECTLSLIIVPMLKKLKETKLGSPFVDVEDVPENLRPTSEANEANGWVDEKHHERWEYVLDEAIWAFEQHADDEDIFSKYTTYDEDRKIHFDKEGFEKHQERMLKGRMLFAKYYDALWS